MAEYVAIASAFTGGEFIRVGDRRTSATHPGWPWVPASTYSPGGRSTVSVDVGSGFIRSSKLAGRTWGLPRGATSVGDKQGEPGHMSKLDGRDPEETRY